MYVFVNNKESNHISGKIQQKTWPHVCMFIHPENQIKDSFQFRTPVESSARSKHVMLLQQASVCHVLLHDRLRQPKNIHEYMVSALFVRVVPSGTGPCGGRGWGTFT